MRDHKRKRHNFYHSVVKVTVDHVLYLHLFMINYLINLLFRKSCTESNLLFYYIKRERERDCHTTSRLHSPHVYLVQNKVRFIKSYTIVGKFSLVHSYTDIMITHIWSQNNSKNKCYYILLVQEFHTWFFLLWTGN